MFFVCLGTVVLLIFVWTKHETLTDYIHKFINETWDTQKNNNASTQIFHKLEKEVRN